MLIVSAALITAGILLLLGTALFAALLIFPLKRRIKRGSGEE